jgi:hypothetical protein
MIIHTTDINSIKIVLANTYVIKVNVVEILFQILDIEFNLRTILVEIFLEAALTDNVALVIWITDNRPDMNA